MAQAASVCTAAETVEKVSTCRLNLLYVWLRGYVTKIIEIPPNFSIQAAIPARRAAQRYSPPCSEADRGDQNDHPSEPLGGGT